MRLLGLAAVAATVLASGHEAIAQSKGDEAPPPPKIEFAGQSRMEKKDKAGTVVMKSSNEWDKVADEAGRIYKSRGYKGVVPGVRDVPEVPSKKKQAAQASQPLVEWVGFQPFSTYSRVFIQVTNDFQFSVTKPRSRTIRVEIPGAKLSSYNDQHYLDTRAFPSAVKRVMIEGKEGDNPSVVVWIQLKKPVGYLYRREGNYIFVDVGL